MRSIICITHSFWIIEGNQNAIKSDAGSLTIRMFAIPPNPPSAGIAITEHTLHTLNKLRPVRYRAARRNASCVVETRAVQHWDSKHASSEITLFRTY